MNKKSKMNSNKKSKKKMAQREGQSSGTAELLLEIGVEELPYQFIAPALSELEKQAAFFFSFHKIQDNDSIKTYATPRRLVLVVERLSTFTDPSNIQGPSKSVAFDQAGLPTKAAIGFAKGQGVEVESLQVGQTPKGQYVYAVKPGRSTEIVLPEILPQIVAELSFPKAMKWTEGGMRFARPIRWLVALLDGKLLQKIEIAGVKASNRTFGHRVMGGGKSIVVRDYDSYNKSLKRAGVMVDPARRRVIIQDQLDKLCTQGRVSLNPDEALIDQAVFTTEWPHAVMGNFKADYLAVPSEILMTSMKEHQGFFSVREKNTEKLAPHFIAVVNNQPKYISVIRAGNERVLAARLADAKFFFDEDRKTSLEERARKLGGVTFHQKLGTMAEKQERIGKLVTYVVSKFNDDPSMFDFTIPCRRAARLCKADLITNVVGEFPELQGIMGGEYAKHDGESENVWKAIRDQYLPRGMEGELPETLEGLALSLADKLDTIVAFFHAGIVPRGSEDPYALRRHALSIVRIIIEGNLRVDLVELVRAAEEIVGESITSQPSLLNSPLSFIFERFKFYAGIKYVKRDDVMSAVCDNAYSRRPIDLLDILEKMKDLQRVSSRPEFDPLMIGFKRASRIVEKEKWSRQPVEPSLFVDSSEQELHSQVLKVSVDLPIHMKNRQYDQALNRLVGLKPGIDAFFAEVMVNAEDQQLRSNRLSLLKDVEELFKSFADFSRIVVQGS
ncbi:Glycine--tRNA ligase beta subunit [Nitrospira sp. KM1]|uniref:glycine--tRNA ligase subunit beta n=1 Tax=Nitrospira sp. KM1 TaxID=1936990 RepID=UPI0013A7211F|nr:glycine--tRNA ligase subunit beta [Nitrospira sp. KM1]BCA53996.1 Glycine--tRNA ligase beta subunit [Nitrospira sp. KM1]